MILGYHTNGLANHSAGDALALLAKTGYQSVALQVDHGWLNPHDSNASVQLQKIKHFFIKHQFSSVIETGARFLLDPESKFSPTLLETDPELVQKRIDYLKTCIDIGVELESDCVSIRSGMKPEQLTFNSAIEQLVRNLEPILKHAEERGIDIGFEPEPGMLIDNTGRLERLLHLIDSPRLKVTLDVGHLFFMTEVPIANYIEAWTDRLVNVHISDMKPGDSTHQFFGEGQIYFPPIIETLHQVGYTKGIHVELNTQSHNAAERVKASYEFLAPIVKSALNSV